jgi:hypothetical protein
VTSGAGSGSGSIFLFWQFLMLAFCPDLWGKFCADHGVGASFYRVCSALSVEQHFFFLPMHMLFPFVLSFVCQCHAFQTKEIEAMENNFN